MSTAIPFPVWPSYADDERAAVDRALVAGKVNYWTGTECREFEREYASLLGMKRAIALMNGTVALELPLRMWGIGTGDEVIVTPRSFMASTSCAVLQGARPVFADVDRESGNITAESIARVLTSRTKAIIPVHLGGWPCEMEDIIELANSSGIKVIEDCAQANGASYRSKPVGAFGHAGAFSFCQDKIITTGGEGGMLVTNDEGMWSQAWAFKDHGKSYDAVHNREHPPGFRWLCDSFGTNWRMTEMQAAIGRIQLKKLPEWNCRRTDNARVLIEGLNSLAGLRVPVPPLHSHHAYYRLYTYLELERLRSGWTRDRIASEITAHGVPCFSGSCSEIYREKAFEGTGLRPLKALPVANELGATSLAFLTHPTLGSEHINRTVQITNDVLRAALR